MSSLRRKLFTGVAFAGALGVAALAALSGATTAHADAADVTQQNARCATRLAITLIGDAPSAELLASQTPQSSVDALIDTPAFRDRFAGFVNAQFNGGPVADPLQDTIYFMSRWVLANNQPWKSLFVGAYDVAPSVDKKSLDVVPSAGGLGYFHTKPWMLRYAGNEESGIRLAAAYRMIQNTTGLQVPATVAKPGEDRTATGRQAPACANCHYSEWFALDKAAALLSRKKVDATGNVTFDATVIKSGPLLGKTLSSDTELVKTLVDSPDFDFAQCRLVFNFLYGRSENQCEAPLFDRCVDALRTSGKIQNAVAVVAKDAAFCQ